MPSPEIRSNPSGIVAEHTMFTFAANAAFNEGVGVLLTDEGKEWLEQQKGLRLRSKFANMCIRKAQDDEPNAIAESMKALAKKRNGQTFDLVRGTTQLMAMGERMRLNVGLNIYSIQPEFTEATGAQQNATLRVYTHVPLSMVDTGEGRMLKNVSADLGKSIRDAKSDPESDNFGAGNMGVLTRRLKDNIRIR